MILVVRAGGPSAGSGYGSQSENGRDHKEDPESPEWSAPLPSTAKRCLLWTLADSPFQRSQYDGCNQDVTNAPITQP